MKYKKAQLGSTLTWVPAFVIIFFLMILFAFATVGLSAKKLTSGEMNEITIAGSSGDFESLNLLKEILNTQIDFEGNNIKFKEAVFLTVEPFTNKNILSKFDEKEKTLNDLKEIFSKSKEDQATYGIPDSLEEKTNEKGSLLANGLDKNLETSEDFELVLPFGNIIKYGNNVFGYNLPDFHSDGNSKSASIDLVYNGRVITIKLYRGSIHEIVHV